MQSVPPGFLPIPKVTVVDALMGAGKTTLAIEEMTQIAHPFTDDDDDGRRFVYITPILKEIERVQKRIPSVVDPAPERGRKLQGLNSLIAKGENIASTHSLFRHVDENTAAALSNYRYTLFIDEVAEWVERYEISTSDLRMLFDQGLLQVNRETKRVDWIDPAGGYRGKFEGLRSLCRLGKIVASRFAKDDTTPVLLLWQMPTEFLAHFERVVVFTHMFEGSDMSAYLRLHGVEIEMMTIDPADRSKMVPYDPSIEAERVEKIRHLVEVNTDKALNAVGKKTGRTNPLSKGWFDNDRKTGETKTKQLHRAIGTFFRKHTGTPSGSPSSRNLWSTFTSYRKALQGNGYARSFIPLNTRATNDYRDRTALAYCVNLYRHPFIRGYFDDHGVPTSDDFYALGTLTQWIWRSAIRDGKPVKVFVPSERMRGLLLDWLDGKLPSIDGAGEGEPDLCVSDDSDISTEKEEQRDTEPEFA